MKKLTGCNEDCTKRIQKNYIPKTLITNPEKWIEKKKVLELIDEYNYLFESLTDTETFKQKITEELE
jgi:hypothetical protein